MAKKKEVIEKEIIENITLSSLDQVMCDDYSIYAKYVIQNRAIPDVRDGLKPVQRRIIYSMYENGYLFNKPTKKCAGIVGDVMGNYHPHGDSSIYEALARMSQNWKINMNLIDFQGNNGSIDGDSPAAYRYTEARLAPLAEELIKDIDKNTVDMVLNFDDTKHEPTVLPARFPNLYLNGTEGIAVAISTEIPPHNLRELINATIYRINHKNCSLDDLLAFVKGPDFPTGGYIINSNGIRDIYENGKGRIDVRCKYDIVEEKDKNSIIISEIPYKVVKKDIVYEIDQIRQSKEVDGITEVIDATEMHKVSIIINIKKESNPQLIMNYLLTKTQLQTSFSANMVAISDGRPQILTLPIYLDAYIKHQKEVVTRKNQFDLEKDNRRLLIVDGLIKAISILDQVIETIKKSLNKSDAKENLCKQFGFVEEQAEAIVNLQLYRLSNTDITKLTDEKQALEHEIADIKAILADERKLEKVIIADLKYIDNKYGIERKTQIVDLERSISIDKRDLISKEDVMISVTRDAYVKRSSLKSYKTSNSILPGIKEKDLLIAADSLNTIDYMLLFTNKGNFVCAEVHEIQENKWKDEGKNINYLSTVPGDEKIVKVIGLQSFREDIFIVTISKFGQIKRTRLSEFVVQRRSKPINSMKLLKNDELVDVAFTNGNNDLLIFSNTGTCTLFNENELSVLNNKTAGVKSISNIKNGEIVSLITLEQNERCKLLLLTDKGNLRIVDSANVTKTERLGKSTIIFKTFKYDPHSLIYVKKLDKNVVSKEEETVLYCLDKNGGVKEVKTNDYHLTPMDKYTKTNIDLEETNLLTNVYNFDITFISDDLKTYEVENKNQIQENNTSIEVKDDDGIDNDEFIQISIFDEIDD